MSDDLTPDQLRHLRLRAQRLVPRLELSPLPVAQVAADICGLQAQDAAAGALSAWTGAPL